MTRPFVLVQLSDPHLGADWADRDPARSLAAVVEAAAGLAPDAVLVSGDLADHGADDEYAELRDLLAPFAAPVHVLAGNQDDRATLRRQFALSGAEEDPIQYVADLGPLRVVALDSTRPAEHPGELDAERLSWLDERLSADPAPTIVALHHPPILVGTPALDAIGLPAEARAGLVGVVARHPHVRALIAGHVHRAIVGELAGRPVLTAPSTYVEIAFDLTSTKLKFDYGAVGFAVHVLDGDRLASHVITCQPA